MSQLSNEEEALEYTLVEATPLALSVILSAFKLKYGELVENLETGDPKLVAVTEFVDSVFEYGEDLAQRTIDRLGLEEE